VKTDVAGDKVAKARWTAAQEKAVAGAKATGQIIHIHPYQAIAVAFGIGALVGFLFARQN